MKSFELRLAAAYIMLALFIASSNAFGQSSRRNGQVELLLRGLMPNKEERVNITLSKKPDFYGPANASYYLSENAEYLKEYGLKGLLVTSYYKAGEIISVELYRFRNYKGAYGAFTYYRIPSDGTVKIGDGSLRSKTSIIFWQNAFLVKLITLGRLPGTVEAMERVARLISKKIGSHKRTPHYVKYLPDKGLTGNSVKFIGGPQTFLKYFKFFPQEFANTPGNIGEGVLAKYRGKYNYSYCLLRYWSDSKAISVLDDLLEELKRQSVDFYYLFDVLYYKVNFVHYKIDRIDNYISIFVYGDENFNYDWFLKRIKKKING